jgi:GTP1/Obg family GTP-binding protein
MIRRNKITTNHSNPKNLTKQDIKELSLKIDKNQKSLDLLDDFSIKLTDVSAKIDRNQKALDQLDTISAKIDRNQKSLDQLDTISAKIDRNQKALDQLDDVGRILRENEQNLKELGGLKHRLDTLDKIMVTVDKIAGTMHKYDEEQTLNSNTLTKHHDRLEKIETVLHIPPSN